MPKAVGIFVPERKDLKSLEGGYVVIKRMNFGEKSQRQALMDGVKFKTGNGKNKDFEGELRMANARVTAYEFATCILEHNLEKDDQGTLLNLASASDLATLDGRVSEEIGILIDEINQFNVDAEGD